MHARAAIGKEASPPSGAEMNLRDTRAVATRKVRHRRRGQEGDPDEPCVVPFPNGTHGAGRRDRGRMHLRDRRQDSDYVFVDRKPNEPLYCTNHPVSSFPGSSTFPEYAPEAEHNTFARMDFLNDLYSNKGKEVFVNKGVGPLTKEDAIAMTDSVHCSFVDDKIAEAGKKERTLLNTTADLSKREFYINFYVRDVEPVPGTNKMKDMMTKRYTFGF